MSDKQPHTCPFHGAQRILLSKGGESYRCEACGWRGDEVAVLMQSEGIGARDAIVRSGERGPSP